jgi:hypothetical protein
MTLTEGMNAEQIIEFAKTRPEFPWQWGIFLNGKETDDYAKENGLTLHWCEPIRPGDIYLAKVNTGYKLLTCRELGEACIHPVEPGYSFDFSKCVKVT